LNWKVPYDQREYAERNSLFTFGGFVMAGFFVPLVEFKYG